MQAAITLDLEPDHAGRAEPCYDGWEPRRVAELLALLKRYQAPLTIFVVGESLSARPETIALFREAGAEFHLHSYSHNLAEPDSLDQIRRGTDAFAKVFGAAPLGYRAPEGRISEAGWQRLEAEGFRFDSSIFPSFWPRPRYLQYTPAPFVPAGTRLLELPISTVTRARLIVSLSWFKLLGFAAYRRTLESALLPEPLVFDMHLHDLWRLPAFDRLPQPWRTIYGRNQASGFPILEEFLALLTKRGAAFTTLGAVAEKGRLAA
jgi:peptidoglycan/xylan/chitin deacetylase (PgdA/CDA1 family)